MDPRFEDDRNRDRSGESGRELNQDERAAQDRTRAGAGGRGESRDPNRCPNCGGPFLTVAIPPIAEDNRQREKLEAHRKKLTDDRGPLQRCAGCGYMRREKDAIEAAKAA